MYNSRKSTRNLLHEASSNAFLLHKVHKQYHNYISFKGTTENYKSLPHQYGEGCLTWGSVICFVYKCIISLFIDVIFCAEKETKNRICSMKNWSGANCITEMFLRHMQFHCLWVHIQTQLHGLWVYMTKFHGLRVYGSMSLWSSSAVYVSMTQFHGLWVHVTQFCDLCVHMTQFHGLGSIWPTMYCKGITVLPVKESPL